MIVVSRITQEQHRCLWTNVLAVFVPENFEGMAVITMAINPHNICFGIHPMDGFADVIGTFKELGHFINSINENERSHFRELALNRVDQHQGEASKRGNASRNIGDNHKFGF